MIGSKITLLCTHSLTLFFVCALVSLGFYLFGNFLRQKLRLNPLDSLAYTVSLGMIGAIFIGWYWYLLDISILYYFYILLALFIYLAVRNIKNVSFNALKYYLLFILIFSIQTTVAFNFSLLPSTIANNDIFHWSLGAEYLLHLNKENIYPGSSEITDAFGSYFILSLLAQVIRRVAFEASTFYIVCCLALLSLAIFEIIKKAFCFNKKSSLNTFATFLLTLLVTGGSFSYYIAYNAFLGELIASCFYLVGLIAIFNKFDQVFKNILLLLFPLLGILLVYQSSFFVYMALLFMFQLIYTLNIKTNLRPQVIAFFLAFFASILLAPSMFIHAVNRTLYVLNSTDGWPLPLLSPSYLTALPINARFGKPGYVITFFFMLAALISTIWLKMRLTKKSKINLSAAISLAWLFGIAVIIYLTIYSVKGETYQVWKLAAFTILPISFVFLAWLGLVIKESIYPVLLFCTCIYLFFHQQPKVKLISFAAEINKIKAIKNDLKKNPQIKNLIIVGKTYPDICLFYNYLEHDYKLYQRKP